MKALPIITPSTITLNNTHNSNAKPISITMMPAIHVNETIFYSPSGKIPKTK